MKKLLTLIVFVLVVGYFIFSNKSEIVKEKAEIPDQIPTEDRVLDYDIKYKDAVKDINEAVDLNLEKHKLIEELDKEAADSPE